MVRYVRIANENATAVDTEDLAECGSLPPQTLARNFVAASSVACAASARCTSTRAHRETISLPASPSGPGSSALPDSIA